MSLELGARTLTGLRVGGSLDDLNALVAAAVQTALTGATEGHHQGTVASKQAFASCLTLLFEGARQDAAATDVQAVLEDASWPSDAVSQFSTLFVQHKDALRFGSAASSAPSLVSLASTAAPSIVDVTWRVDDFLKSDSLDLVRQPSYLVTLTTTNPVASLDGGAHGHQSPATTQVPFSCNFQQLQDLLAKLKDAQKQIQQRVE